MKLPDVDIPHPRLLLFEGEEQKLVQELMQDSLWSLFQERTLRACDRLLLTEPLERLQTGRRLLVVSREALYRIFMLSYAWRTTGEPAYAERAEKEMLSISRYEDWNPEHFLDVAEMTMAFSIGYGWMYDFLSPQSRQIIRRAILEKGLLPSLDERYNGFLEKTNNWNQVCHTAMAYGAIALMDEEPGLALQLIERVVEGIRVPMNNYAPEGAYPEGYGYWHYGTTYNVMLLAVLDKLYGTDFGLSEIPGFMRTPEYVLHMVGPTSLPFNFGDSGGRMRLNTSLFWFARKKGDAALLRYECRQLLETESYDYEEYRRMLPSVFVLGAGLPLSQIPDPSSTLFVARNDAPVVLMRSAWRDDAMYVAIKGGSASSNTHTHLDAGSFVMDAMGERWVVDLGPQDYHSLEAEGLNIWDNSEGGSRWSIYRYTNFTHNVITLNDQLFNTRGGRNYSERRR
ncbi:MAG: heparinase II/III family protein [Bacteroides sp.]|nr:heparinase II/III family protein [Bacteroides sp.]